MQELKRLLSQIPASWTEDVLRYRAWLAKSGPGNICTPGNLSKGQTYAPFMHQDYPYQDKLKYLNTPEWAKLLRTPAPDLIAVDPFTPSNVRQGGFMVWDAAIAIPAAAHRNEEPMRISEIKPIRNCNGYWNIDLKQALGRVGPLGKDGAIVRPQNQYILDLRASPYGYWLLNLCHVLAHKMGDDHPHDPGFPYRKTLLAHRMQNTLAEIAFAMIFDMPLDIGDRQEGIPARPDSPGCGIEIKSTSYFQDGFARIPIISKESLRVDETLAVVSVSIFVEPPPNGFVANTMIESDDDRWACMPTMAMITGWELVDVITHLPLISSNPHDNHKDVCYGLTSEDMMPPSYLPAYLSKAREHFGEPMEAIQKWANSKGHPEWVNNFMYVGDYMASDRFVADYNNTPPLLCEQCANWNPRSEGTPERPHGREPKRYKLKDNPEWDNFKSTQRNVVKTLIAPATERYEAKLLGKRFTKRSRRARRRANKLKWDGLLASAAVKRLEEKYVEKGHLTERETLRYNTLQTVE